MRVVGRPHDVFAPWLIPQFHRDGVGDERGVEILVEIEARLVLYIAPGPVLLQVPVELAPERWTGAGKSAEKEIAA
jgi:hypothetical protein